AAEMRECAIAQPLEVGGRGDVGAHADRPGPELLREPLALLLVRVRDDERRPGRAERAKVLAAEKAERARHDCDAPFEIHPRLTGFVLNLDVLRNTGSTGSPRSCSRTFFASTAFFRIGSTSP